MCSFCCLPWFCVVNRHSVSRDTLNTLLLRRCIFQVRTDRRLGQRIARSGINGPSSRLCPNPDHAHSIRFHLGRHRVNLSLSSSGSVHPQISCSRISNCITPILSQHRSVSLESVRPRCTRRRIRSRARPSQRHGTSTRNMRTQIMSPLQGQSLTVNRSRTWLAFR